MQNETIVKVLRKREDFNKKPVDFMEFPDEEVPSESIVQVKERALSILTEAKAIVVHDQDTLDHANGFLRGIQKLIGRIEETFDPQIKSAHELHRSLLAEKKKFTEQPELAEKAVRRTIAAYLDEEDRKRRAIERERAQIEEKARDIADKATAAAEKHELNGKLDKAIEVIEKASEKTDEIMATAPEVPEAPKADGLSLRTVWKFDIIDADAIPREYLVVDEKKIGRVIRAMGNSARIPGVRIYSEKTLATREF